MSRLPPRHLRLVAAPVERTDDRQVTIPIPAEPAGAVIAAHVEAYIHCGRHVIAAAVAAIVDAAADYGLEGGPWDPDDVRREITDIVTRRMHDTIISHITRSGGIAADAATDRLGPTDDRDA